MKYKTRDGGRHVLLTVGAYNQYGELLTGWHVALLTFAMVDGPLHSLACFPGLTHRVRIPLLHVNFLLSII